MGAIGLNPIRLDRIGLDPIRINAIKLGVPGAASDRPYIDPEVLASLKAVCICYGKSNDDPDRAIIKNLVDPDNPFVISNAAFKLNSGFGKYSADFESFDWTVGISQKQHNKASISLNGRLCNHAAIEVEEMKVNIIGNVTELIYWYIANPDDTARSEIRLTSGINTLPKSYAKEDGQTYNIGFAYISGDNEITIEQIPSFEGAFVTDGIDDLITSTKTVQEMLGGSNEITVVSMVHQVKDTANNVSFTNYIRGSANGYFRNIVNNYGKTGIYGYTSSDLRSLLVINNILGDKNDYTSNGDNRDTIINGNFSVQGYSYNNSNNTGDFSSVAWYWTVIANKGLTTDQINQVIAYFNLDRTLNPDILCNTIKQGITNENHAEFGDKLIDYSGNGRDIQLNNIAWKGDSGIGKYNFSNINIISSNRFEGAVTTNKCHFTKKLTNTTNNFCDLVVISPNEPIKFKVSGLSDGRKLFIANKSGSGSNYNFDNGEHEVSLSFSEGVGQNNPFGVTGDIGDIDVTVEFIPSHAGALCLDGVNDFGKVTGMPIYKDYTVIADYERFYLEPITGGRASILSKSSKVGDGSFIFNLEDQDGGKACYTFGEANGNISDDITRIIRYQSKYYNTKTLSIGTAEDNDFMVLGKVREVDSRYFCGAIYSLMTFPYSMSEFLIERQLKKHKLGTLYPDMVEFRPVIKSNASYDNIVFYYKNEKVENGTYLTVGSSIGMYIRLSSNPVNEIKSITINGIPATFKFHDANNNIYQYDFNLTSKSPQKINITIDEYIRYEDIVQPYPLFFEFTDENGNLISWGGKAKVGSTITRTKGVNYANLLEGLFTITNPRLNGVPLASSQHVVEKSMVFTCTATWAFDNNEPKCILSPRLLRIPNSSYKILGYIPDISGHGNHGKINNSAYAEGSGVNEDGSYQFDGVDDFVTIPTIVGGKQVLMKVNWQSDAAKAILYDQRGYNNEFVIYNGTTDSDGNPIPAYQGRNDGQTYIDGILNSNIKASELKAITHNITITNELSLGTNNTYPVIGSNRLHNAYFVNMALYDFMLFDEISTDDKILELNEYVGIEGNTDDLFNETN